jgi:hypothetical protein
MQRDACAAEGGVGVFAITVGGQFALHVQKAYAASGTNASWARHDLAVDRSVFGIA